MFLSGAIRFFQNNSLILYEKITAHLDHVFAHVKFVTFSHNHQN